MEAVHEKHADFRLHDSKIVGEVPSSILCHQGDSVELQRDPKTTAGTSFLSGPS